MARGLGTSVKLRPEADPRSLLSPRKPEAHEAHHHHLSHHGRLSSPEAGHLASLQPSPASAAHGTPLRGAHGTPLASPQPGALGALGSGSGALAGLLSDPAHPSHPAHAAHAALAAHPAQPSRKHLRRSSSGDVPRSSPSGLLLPGNQADMNAGLGQRGRRRHTHNLDHDGSSGLGSSPAAGMSTLEEREREAHGNLPALELPARRGVSWSRSVGAKGGAIAAQEVALLTIETPPSIVVRIAGVVSARSVKLFSASRNPQAHLSLTLTLSLALALTLALRLSLSLALALTPALTLALTLTTDPNPGPNRTPQAQRDAWWSEIREEIRAHARSLACNTVIGYAEDTSYHDDLCVLSACGTAALLKLPEDTPPERYLEPRPPPPPCTLGHTPYLRSDSPFPMRLELCALCRRKFVPELLLATVDVPESLPCVGAACSVQARVCRVKKNLQGEASATAVSEALPFLEFDLHRQLMYKLKI